MVARAGSGRFQGNTLLEFFADLCELGWLVCRKVGEFGEVLGERAVFWACGEKGFWRRIAGLEMGDLWLESSTGDTPHRVYKNVWVTKEKLEIKEVYCDTLSATDDIITSGQQ